MILMHTQKVPAKGESHAVRYECSVEAISERLFERSLTFREIAELSEKCGLWNIEKESKTRTSRPFTFTVPATQLVTSVSRFVE
jgi:hypothetical protein